MDDAYDVPDSTDWLNTPLQDFSSLENVLHCQICKEFYDTPMITTCNHTFCSKCIRTSLSADGKCPACRASDQASKLRNNWALQEVVSAFLAARPSALQVARQAQEDAQTNRRPGKRKRTTVPDDDEATENANLGRTTRSKSRRIAASQTSQPDTIEIEDSEDEHSEIEAETVPDDGLVECPLGCGKRMKEEQVFGHLDRCEDEKKQEQRNRSRTPLNSSGISKQSLSQNTRPQDRINELNYSMMKEAALSKKLKELGLPNWGSKQLMINRHREWVNIWNANCDSISPRSRRELLHDLDTWERTQGGRAPQVNGLSSTIMRKDFDGDAYSRRHRDEFSRLIEDAKRKSAAVEKPRPGDEDDAQGSPRPVPTNGGLLDGLHDVETSQRSATKNMDPQPQPVKTELAGDSKPYENNPQAISSIREKVEALNHGKHIEPVINEGFRNPAVPMIDRSSSVDQPKTGHDLAFARSHDGPSMFNKTIVPPITSSTGQSLPSAHAAASSVEGPQSSLATLKREGSKDEHYTQQTTASPCDMPAHLHLGSSRTVNMFDLPQQPVMDMDGAADAS